MKYNSTASYDHIYNEIGKLPFTYIIGWSKYNKFYYGVRYGKNCHPKDLFTTYFTSSKTVCQFRKDHGTPDIIQIRQVFTNHITAVNFEDKVIRRLKMVRSDKWLNIGRSGKEFCCVEKSEKARQRMSVAQRGKKHTKESIDKMCKAQKGHKGTTNGTQIWNDGKINFFIPINETPESHLVLGMLRKKHNENKPGTNRHNVGKVYYNDGVRNYFIPYEQEPEKNWIAGMLPKKSRPCKVKS